MKKTISEQALKQIVPSSLDDIVRIHRDELTVRLSTAEDLAELPSMVSVPNDQIQVRATIHEWRIICLDHNAAGKKHILTDYIETTNSVWGTSMLISADLDKNLILTENSVYRLGTKGNGEPTTDLLLHICYLFHSWCFGARYGVPEIFYSLNSSA